MRNKAAIDYRENTQNFERKITKAVLARGMGRSADVEGRNVGYVQEGGF